MSRFVAKWSGDPSPHRRRDEGQDGVAEQGVVEEEGHGTGEQMVIPRILDSAMWNRRHVEARCWAPRGKERLSRWKWSVSSMIGPGAEVMLTDCPSSCKRTSRIACRCACSLV